MVLGEIAGAERVEFREFAFGHIRAEIVRRCLIGDDVGDRAAFDHRRKDLGGVSDEADRERATFAFRFFRPAQGFVEGVRHAVAVAFVDFAGHAVRAYLDVDHHAFVHRDGHRLSSAHAAEPRREYELAREGGHAKVLLRERQVGLIRALEDPLGADVDPRAGGHLAVHHEPLAVVFVELRLGCPLRHEVRGGDEYARRVLMRLRDVHGASRLHAERLVRAQMVEAGDDFSILVPIARGAPAAAVDDQSLPIDGVGGIEVVHQEPLRRLRIPRARDLVRSSGRVDGRCGRGGHVHRSPVLC